MMQEQRDDLKKRLEEDGWQVIEEDNTKLEWRAAEIWRVESFWSPQGFSLWLTFLIDEAASPESSKSEKVWAIGTSRKLPLDQQTAQGKPFLTFGQGWGTRASQFMSELARIRHEAYVAKMKEKESN
jgi:hypothetical protein